MELIVKLNIFLIPVVLGVLIYLSYLVQVRSTDLKYEKKYRGMLEEKLFRREEALDVEKYKFATADIKCWELRKEIKRLKKEKGYLKRTKNYYKKLCDENKLQRDTSELHRENDPGGIRNLGGDRRGRRRLPRSFRGIVRPNEG